MFQLRLDETKGFSVFLRDINKYVPINIWNIYLYVVRLK